MASWVSASDTQPALFLAGTHTQSCEALSGARMHSHIAALAHVFAKHLERNVSMLAGRCIRAQCVFFFSLRAFFCFFCAGRFNRAQRAYQNYLENAPHMTAVFILAGFVFPFPAFVLLCLFMLARNLAAYGYINAPDGRMAGNMLGGELSSVPRSRIGHNSGSGRGGTARTHASTHAQARAPTRAWCGEDWSWSARA